MALSDQVNNYCERLSPEFWSEPLNAVTNVAFIVAAVAAFVLWRRKTPDDMATLFLIAVVLLTGVGSFLFHTFATKWASMADVIPIAIFIHVYLLFALRRFLDVHWVVSVCIVIGFFVLSPMVGEVWAPVIGSSAAYLPALLALLVVGAMFYQRDKRLGGQVLAIGGLFTLSLVFRMLDEPLCAQWAFGTHFLWHILNSIVLFALLRVLISHRAG
ncbi:MAG: ceramidase domain-containing protein [Roseibium sp.]